MAGIQIKSFDQPDEAYEFEDGRSRGDFVTIDDTTISRSRLAPGWNWDEFVKPMTDGWTTCQEEHREYVLSGRIRYLMEDGTETIASPGSYLHIPSGHRAWVEGDEDCVTLDW
jgi:ethanolamine utilization protein EutQ (cupin superfamily)